MININSNTANDAWVEAVKNIQAYGHIQEGRDQETKELLHVGFTLHDPRQRIIFARDINPAFAIAEVLWILSGSNDLNFLSFWNPRMKEYSDDEFSLYGAYGFRLGRKISLPSKVSSNWYRGNSYRPNGIDQIRTAYNALKKFPESRQVVLQIWDSYSDLPAPVSRSKDIPCNLMSHLLVRDNKLEWLQVMRSNDLFWGTPYNFIQFTIIQEIMAGWLGIDVGDYTHISDSLHVYKRHFNELKSISLSVPDLPENRADLRIEDIDKWEEIWRELLIYAVGLTKLYEIKGILDAFERIYSFVPSAYAELAAVLAAEVLRKNGHVVESYKMIQNAGEYWEYSWLKWAQSNKLIIHKKEDCLPKFIVFEGPDGVGKTTYVKLLKTYLEQKLYKEVFEDGYPGNMVGTLGEFIYKMHHNNFPNAPKVETIKNSAVQLLHIAAHVDKIESYIKPSFDKGKTVLLDRYWWSTYAYSRTTMSKEKALELLTPELIAWREVGIKPLVFYLKPSNTFKHNEITNNKFIELSSYYNEVIELERQNEVDVIEIQNDSSMNDVFNLILKHLRI